MGVPDEEMHRHATETLDQADALLFGRVTYEMMEAAFRPEGAIEGLKREPGEGLLAGGVKRPLALAMRYEPAPS